MYQWEQKTKELVNDENIYQKLCQYVNLIIEKNKEFNLTGFDEEKIWLEGIYQSIFLLKKNIDFDNNKNKLLDIGAGAGFPSIPFYIFSKDKIELTIYEPIKKRVDFLNLVKKELNLKNINVVNKRIEEHEKEHYNYFDYITARAVMSLKMLIEISSSVGKLNAKYIFLKSKDVYNEIYESKWIINQLDIQNIKVKTFDLNDNKVHNIVIYIKSKNTPKKFPRKWSEIKRDIKIT